MHSIPTSMELLFRRKGIVLHTGILWQGRVIHIRPGSGLQTTSFEEFAAGQSVRRMSIQAVDIEAVLERLEVISQLNLDYSLFSNNCEHIANFLITGNKISPQLQLALLMAGIGGFVGNHNGWKGTICGATILGLGSLAISNAIKASRLENYPSKDLSRSA